MDRLCVFFRGELSLFVAIVRNDFGIEGFRVGHYELYGRGKRDRAVRLGRR